LSVVFYVVGALFLVYLIAAAWRSRDADSRSTRSGRR
jgi:threonine/homoserine/homoserine lactone efflux protein